MSAIKYEGRSSDGVTIELPDGPVHVRHGETVDVPNSIAKALTKTSQWSKSAGKSTPKTTDTKKD